MSKFGDWACSVSEDVENVKSLRHTDSQTGRRMPDTF